MGKNHDAALAVRRGDVDGLRDALERGANPNHVGNIFGPTLDCEWSLLETAARNGNVDCCTLLVAAGVDVNSISPFTPQGTPLHPACGQGDAAVVSLLLAAGADVDVRDYHGATPLHDACRSGRPVIVSLLLAAGADVDVRTRCGTTPLHSACGSGHAAVVSLLLAAGADVDVRGLSGYTPLFTACNCAHGMFPRSRFRGHAAIVQLLLDTGATNLRDRATSLERALLWGQRECVLALLRAGAELVIPPQDVVQRFVQRFACMNYWHGKRDLYRHLEGNPSCEPIVRRVKIDDEPTALLHWRAKCAVRRRVKKTLRKQSSGSSCFKRLNDFLVRIRDAGGWDAHVRRHRALLVGRLRDLLRLPEDALGLIVDFSAPPGGN